MYVRFGMSSLNSAKEINKYLNLDDDNENEEQKIKLEINENASDNEDAEDANANAEDESANASDNENADTNTEDNNGLVKNIEKFENELAQQNPMNTFTNGFKTIRKYFDTRSLEDNTSANEDKDESEGANENKVSRRTVKRYRTKRDNDLEDDNSLIGKLKRLAKNTDGNIEMKIKVTRKGNRNKNDKNKTKKHYWSSAKTNKLLRRPRIKISTRNKNKYPGRVRNLNGNITRTYKKSRSQPRSRSQASPHRKNGNDWLLRQKLGMS